MNKFFAGISSRNILTWKLDMKCKMIFWGEVFSKSLCFLCFLSTSWLPPLLPLGHCQEGSLTNPMLITAFYLFRPEGYRERRNKVGSLSLVKHLVGFEPGTLIMLVILSEFRRINWLLLPLKSYDFLMISDLRPRASISCSWTHKYFNMSQLTYFKSRY